MTICIIRKSRKKLMQKSKWIIWLIGCCFVISCGKQIPTDVIQPGHMEDILYDYHLSVSMANNLKSDEYYKRKAYQDYVFQKHGITEAEFDSSMVWYTRHTDELSTIYSNLNKRFKQEKEHIDMFLSAREADGYISLPGDTVDIWPYRRLYWLKDNIMNNQFTFEIEPDSNFHIKDVFLWKANYTFLAKGKATMALNVLYTNDSVIGQNKQIVQSGMNSIYLHTDSTYQIKKINGFIFVSGDSVYSPNVIVNELSLTKYHTLSDSINVMKDSLNIIPQSKTKKLDPSEKIKKLDTIAPIKLQRKLPTD